MWARWPAPSVMISSAPSLTPPQNGANAAPRASATRIMPAGTSARAVRDRCSSAAESRRLCSATRVSRARNSPVPVPSRPTKPSSRKAISKFSTSLNTDVTLSGMSTRPYRYRAKGAGGDARLAIHFRQKYPAGARMRSVVLE